MDIRSKQRAVVDALEDIKGHDIVVYNTAALPTMFERVVIASGDSTRQVKALADHVHRGRLPRLAIEKVDGEPVVGSDWGATLIELGFRAGPRKLTLSA